MVFWAFGAAFEERVLLEADGVNRNRLPTHATDITRELLILARWKHTFMEREQNERHIE